MRMISQIFSIWLIIILLLILPATRTTLASGPSEKAPIPNVDFEVAAKRVDNHARGNAIYIFRLYCALGACSLEQLALNECEDSPSGLAFTPKLNEWATWAGNLEVKLLPTNILEVKVFQGSHKMLPALLRLTFRPELPSAKQVSKFQASGFLDFSTKEGLRGHTPVEFAALPDSIQTIRMDCPVLLRGLEKEAR